MVKENISQEFRLKNDGETRNYFIKEVEKNQSMSKKHKKVSMTLNYIEHFLILASSVTGCISISAFASLLGIFIGISSSAIGLKRFAITAGIKRYKSLIKRKKKKQNKIVLLAKSKLDNTEVLIYKSLIDSYISHNEFVLINNALKNMMLWKKKLIILKLHELIVTFNILINNVALLFEV